MDKGDLDNDDDDIDDYGREAENLLVFDAQMQGCEDDYDDSDVCEDDQDHDSYEDFSE